MNQRVLLELPPDHLEPLEGQPRRYFDPLKLEDLAQKIRDKGVLQPLLVRPRPDRPGNYQIVAGERRWRASQMAGLSVIPCTVRDLDDGEALELALMENLDREDLNPVEEVEAVCRILQNRTGLDLPSLVEHLYRMRNATRRGTDEHNIMFSPTTRTIQGFFGSRQQNWESFVVNKLPVLDLPEPLRQALLRGDLEYTKARALNKLKDPQLLEGFLNQAIGEGWGLEQLRQAIKPHIRARPKPPSFQRYLNAIGRAVNGIPDPAMRQKVEALLMERFQQVVTEIQSLNLS